jgi:hypothetical protein
MPRDCPGKRPAPVDVGRVEKAGPGSRLTATASGTLGSPTSRRSQSEHPTELHTLSIADPAENRTGTGICVRFFLRISRGCLQAFRTSGWVFTGLLLTELPDPGAGSRGERIDAARPGSVHLSLAPRPPAGARLWGWVPPARSPGPQGAVPRGSAPWDRIPGTPGAQSAAADVSGRDSATRG